MISGQGGPSRTPGLSSSSSAPTFLRGRAKACTSCRQVKLRCNARETFPLPCTRCKAQELECKFDSNFKRIPAKRCADSGVRVVSVKRKLWKIRGSAYGYRVADGQSRRQLEEVSNRLSDLQRSLGLQQPQSSTPRWQSTTSSDLETQEYPSRENTGLSGPSAPTKWLQLQEHEPGPWEIGGIAIDTNSILQLFQHFEDYFYCYIPCLEPCTSLSGLYHASPVLFWTIVVVSSRFHPSLNSLYSVLLVHQKALLTGNLLDLPSLKGVHSILIMCLWPNCVQSEMREPAWNLSGLAISISMALGLHTPQSSHEYVKPLQDIPGTVESRWMTWLMCFEINTSLATWLGVHPLLSTPFHQDTIMSLTSLPAIPSSLSASAEIERRIIPMILALDAASDSRTRMSLIEVFDRDLNQVQNTYERVWTEDLEIHLQGAKLFLYGFSISPVGKHTTSAKSYQVDSSVTTLRIVVQLGLAAAVRIARVACQLRYYVVHVSGKAPAMSPPTSGGNLVHPPKQHFRTLFFATVFLLWFLAIEIQASDTDKELARNYIGAMHRLFLSFTASPEHLRVAKTIEVLGRVPASASASLSNVSVSGRLGASFMYTVLRNCMIYGNTSRLVPEMPLPQAGGDDARSEDMSGGEEPYGARKGSSSQMSQASQGGDQAPIETFFPEDSQQFLQDIGEQAWELGYGGWMGGMGAGFDEYAHVGAAGVYQDVVSSPEGQAGLMGVAPGPSTQRHGGQYGYGSGGGSGVHGGHGGEYR